MSVFPVKCQQEEVDYAQKIQSENERAAVEQQRLEQKRHEELVEHQRQLEQQLVDRERQRQEAHDEILREKLQVDEIIRKIYEEEET